MNESIFIQVGNLGGSVIDHLISPIAQVKKIQKIKVFCRFPGPPIPKVEYHSPPKFLANYVLTSIIYEIFGLFYYALAKKPTYMAGYKLFPHGLMAVLIAKVLRKPVIVSLISGPIDLYSINDAIGVNYSDPLPKIGRILLKVLMKSDAIVTTGSFTKIFLQKQGVPESKIYPIIHPANISNFHPSDIPKRYDVVSVGRLIPLKHHEVLMQAIYKVKNDYPQIKACIIGDGPCRRELTQLANELGIYKNIDFQGFQTDVARFYHSSKIFVHTSEREGFPNVVLEAMMCGLPCIISKSGDVIDVARDGFNSLVIQQFNDYERFAQAISKVLSDKEFYQQLSHNALTTVNSISSMDATQKWETILTSCHVRRISR